MNSTFFECKVSYLNLTGDGKIKKVNESIMVDALSFAESEMRVMDEMGTFEGITIKEIKRSSYSEILIDTNNPKESYFKCKVSMTLLDENTGREKKTPFYYLVNGNTVMEALTKLNKEIVEHSVSDVEVNSVSETSVADVIFTAEKIQSMNDDKESLLTSVQCLDACATINPDVLKKEVFSITFDNDATLIFENKEDCIECIETSDGFDKYLGEKLEYSKK